MPIAVSSTEALKHGGALMEPELTTTQDAWNTEQEDLLFSSETIPSEIEVILLQRLEEQGLWCQRAFQHQMSHHDQQYLKRLLYHDQTVALAILMERYGRLFGKIAYYTVFNYDLAQD